MKEIPLTQGKVALVDDEDYERLMQHKWCAHRPSGSRVFYAIAHVRIGPRRYGKLRMHRLLVDAPLGMEVDHRNGNGLDNRKVNLRMASSTENKRNVPPVSVNTTGFKGVSRRDGKWRARIWNQGRQQELGVFATAEEAAKAYDTKACELFGEFAWLNFPSRRLPDRAFKPIEDRES